MSKTFEFRHLIFETMKVQSEDNFPEWLLHKEYRWFLNDYVLALAVGAFVETDFHRITRLT